MLPRGVFLVAGAAAISTNTHQDPVTIVASLKDSYGLYDSLAEFTCAKLEPLVQQQCGQIALYNALPWMQGSEETCTWALANWPELQTKIAAHITYSKTVDAATGEEIDTMGVSYFNEDLLFRRK